MDGGDWIGQKSRVDRNASAASARISEHGFLVVEVE